MSLVEILKYDTADFKVRGLAVPFELSIAINQTYDAFKRVGSDLVERLSINHDDLLGSYEIDEWPVNIASNKDDFRLFINLAEHIAKRREALRDDGKKPAEVDQIIQSQLEDITTFLKKYL